MTEGTLIQNGYLGLPLNAIGGTVTEIIQSGKHYRIHAFTSTGFSNFAILSGEGDADVLIIGGGGGGGTQTSGAGAAGGGGGAGGAVSKTVYLSEGIYTVGVGAGGSNRASGTTNIYAENGDESSAFGFTAIGGGGGGTRDYSGRDGASGGGTNLSISGFGNGQTGQGFRGGGGANGGNPSAGGGGGGAGQPGEDAKNVSFSTDVAGAGGAGLDFSGLFGDGYGDDGWFSGGGGGGNGNAPSDGTGGKGGGGNGGAVGSAIRSNSGFSGVANTGGGGGGSAGTASGGSGGSGIVLIRYRVG